ncbi:MAG: WD40 repeat domain-containing protein [Planctomycetia bacterium]
MIRLEGHVGRVRTGCFSPDGRRLYTGGDDGAVCLWNLDDGSLARRWSAADAPPAHPDRQAFGLAFVDGGRLAGYTARGLRSPSSIGPVVVLLEPGASRALVADGGDDEIELDAPASIVVSPNRRDWPADGDQEPVFWHRTTLDDAAPASEPRPLFAAAFDGSCWATAEAGEVRTTAWPGGERLERARRFKSPPRALALRDDGLVAAAAVGREAVVWPVGAFDERWTLVGSLDVVADVAFAPGEVGRRLLATAGHDRSVRFWDVQAGRPTAVFDWALGKIDFVTFSRDGMRVAAGGSSGAVVVWDVEIC